MEIMPYEGYHDDKATCGICVYQPKDKPVVIALLELPENQSTSITNRSERCFYKAWKILGQPWPCIFVECYTRGVNLEYDMVSFKCYNLKSDKPIVSYRSWKNTQLKQFEDAEWTHLTQEKFKELITGSDNIVAKDEASEYVYS